MNKLNKTSVSAVMMLTVSGLVAAAPPVAEKSGTNAERTGIVRPNCLKEKVGIVRPNCLKEKTGIVRPNCFKEKISAEEKLSR